MTLKNELAAVNEKIQTAKDELAKKMVPLFLEFSKETGLRATGVAVHYGNIGLVASVRSYLDWITVTVEAPSTDGHGSSVSAQHEQE